MEPQEGQKDEQPPHQKEAQEAETLRVQIQKLNTEGSRLNAQHSGCTFKNSRHSQVMSRALSLSKVKGWARLAEGTVACGHHQFKHIVQTSSCVG